MTNIKHYTINECRLFEAKDIIKETGITVTNASVVTRMLARYSPYTQTAKEWRDAGANIPNTVRDNTRIMTEQQVARYLSNIPQKACPELHKMFKEVKEFVDYEGDRVFECDGIIFEYSTDQRMLMDELVFDKEYNYHLDKAITIAGMVIDYPVEVEVQHRSAPGKYLTKVEVPFFDSVNGIAHFFMTTEQMTKWKGVNFYGEGTVEVKSKEYEELKKIANAVSDKLGCEYFIHIIEKEDSTPVVFRDDSYYFDIDLSKDDCPF